MCLDDVTPADEPEACRHLLAGDSGNRWFDKAVSLIVLADGTSGINVEHCELDGTTVLTLVDAMFDEPVETHASRIGARRRARPRWRRSSGARRRAARRDPSAAEEFDRLPGRDRDAARSRSTTSAPSDAKALKLLAGRVRADGVPARAPRAKGLTGATYESIATRQFHHGRTEAMRVVTPEIVAFVDAMQDPAAVRRREARGVPGGGGRARARAKECQAGHAPEQHLWELQLIQQRRGASSARPSRWRCSSRRAG